MAQGRTIPRRPSVPRPGWPVTLASLIAIDTLYLQTRFAPLLVASAVVLGVQVTRWRVPRSFLLNWLMRGLIFAAIIATGREQSLRGGSAFLDLAAVNVIGYLAAAELAIRCWLAGDKPENGPILLLSAVVFTAATNTFDRSLIQYVGPLYMLMVILSLRGFRPVKPSGALPLRAVSVTASMLIGLGVFLTIFTWGDAVFVWSIEFLRGGSSADVGLSGSPALGRSFNIRPTATRVLRIRNLQGDGHLRAGAFEFYLAGRWGPPLDIRPFQAVTADQLGSSAAGPRMAVERLLDDPLRMLVGPLESAGFVPMPGSELEWDSTSGRCIRAWKSGSEEYSYDVIGGRAGSGTGPLAESLSAERRSRCLDVPDDLREAIEPLARQAAGDGPPLQKVERIIRYLQANHEYSLQVRPGSGDPIADFLLNRRSAHCQYFASAAAMMLRCVGIPARNVNGYYAHESGGANITVVRQRDAHAWAECWIDGVGWITVEATPASGRPDELFEAVGGWRRRWERITDWFRDLWRWLRELGWQRLLLVGGAVVGVSAGSWRLWQWMRNRLLRRRNERSYAAPDPLLRELARRFERLLLRRGLACEACRPWGEQLAGADDAELRQFVETYNAARFGGRRDDQAIAELRQTLARMEKQ